MTCLRPTITASSPSLRKRLLMLAADSHVLATLPDHQGADGQRARQGQSLASLDDARAGAGN